MDSGQVVVVGTSRHPWTVARCRGWLELLAGGVVRGCGAGAMQCNNVSQRASSSGMALASDVRGEEK